MFIGTQFRHVSHSPLILHISHSSFIVSDFGVTFGSRVYYVFIVIYVQVLVFKVLSVSF
jgi:hypothetical protein